MISYSNFITPPDFFNKESVDSTNDTILIVDADWLDVDQVAAHCKFSDKSYNVYLYNSENNDLSWLITAAQRSKSIIVNTESTTISHIKDKWAEMPQNYFYGPKGFLKNANHQISRPVDYFTLTK